MNSIRQIQALNKRELENAVYVAPSLPSSLHFLQPLFTI